MQTDQNKGSLGSRSHWFMNALIPGFFCFWPPAPADTHLFFLMMALQFFVVLFIYPETNGVFSGTDAEEAGACLEDETRGFYL